jgi:hypothetical protein
MGAIRSRFDGYALMHLGDVVVLHLRVRPFRTNWLGWRWALGQLLLHRVSLQPDIRSVVP